MRSTQWLISLFLVCSMITTAMAAESTTANETGKLETINATPAALEQKIKDCPMHQGKTKEFNHKNGEPCPYHQDEKNLGKAHEKCDHKHHS
jgi:hypothetical protein